MQHSGSVSSLPTPWAIAITGSVLAITIYLLTRKTKRVRDSSNPYSVPVAPNSGAPRRNESAVNGLTQYLSPDAKTLFHNLQYAVKHYGKKDCFGTRRVLKNHEELRKGPDGAEKKWVTLELSPFEFLTFEQVSERALQYGSGIRHLGLKPGKNFALYDETKLEWSICEHGCFSQNIVLLTVYANLGDEGLIHAIQQGEITHLQTNATNLRNLSNVITQIPTVKYVVYVGEADPKQLKTLSNHGITLLPFEEVLKLGKEHPYDPVPPKPEDIAVIMYTSGSTGMPKGVLISHANMISALAGVSSGIQLTSDDIYLSFLPLAHVLALAIENGLIFFGCKQGYGNPRTLTDQTVKNCRGDLRELCPTLFAGVPTIYDKIKKGIETKIATASPLKQRLFKTAFNAKLAAIESGGDSPFWNLLVFNKLKEALGGRVRLVVSGGAPLSPEAHGFLRVCFSAPVMQGYGLTETCGGGTLMAIEDVSTGRVGPPVPCTEIKLVDVTEMGYTCQDTKDGIPYPRGEIWIRGPNVSPGYYKAPEQTKDAFHNGWFATGDVGEWYPDGTLKIIDRKKNLVKPPHGEYVALEKLECIYKNCKYAHNICIYADGEHNEVVAVIDPNVAALKEWAEKNQKSTDINSLCKDSDLKKEILKNLSAIGSGSNLKSFEVVKGVAISPEEWTPENNFLTAAMKLNRREVIKQFKKEIDDMYSKMPPPMH